MLLNREYHTSTHIPFLRLSPIIVYDLSRDISRKERRVSSHFDNISSLYEVSKQVSNSFVDNLISFLSIIMDGAHLLIHPEAPMLLFIPYNEKNSQSIRKPPFVFEFH